MKTSVSFRETFEASHTVLDDPLCGVRHHGHTWVVDVTVAGTPDSKTGSIDTSAALLLQALVLELDLRSANEMLPGLFPTIEGIAGYIFERFRLECPGLQSVKVGDARHFATVEV